MSLDRQRILNELGSVMNQLQSVDCGCMGKLFSDQKQNQGASMGTPMPTCGGCRRGCSHSHGYNYSTPPPCAGEPYSANHSMNQPCMGRCNPPKLYADTYSYLNNNLMQPVMKEVYDDLKSITPGNTIMNSPLANQMGLSQGNTGAMPQGNAPNLTMANPNMSGMESANATSMKMDQQPMNAMGGMGPQIVNMIMGDSGTKSNNGQGIQGGQADSTMMDASPPPHSQIGYSMNPSFGGNQGQNANMMNTFNQQGNTNSSLGQNPHQYMSHQPNMYSGTSGQGNSMMANVNQNTAPQGTPQMGNVNNAMVSGSNTFSNQMTPANNKYGQHTQGVMKFNEMFPGVMQGGDLGFDPMAIAIQMNPANQQKAAMDTMQKLMNGGPMSKAGDPSVMSPVMNATKAAIQSVNTVPAHQTQQNASYVNQMGNQQMPGDQQNNLGTVSSNNPQIISGQQAVHQNAGFINSQSNAMPQNQQQVFTAVTGATVPNRQLLQQQSIPQQQVMQQQPMQQQQPMHQQQPMQAYQQQLNPNQQYHQSQTQYLIDPNTGATLTPPTMPIGYNEGLSGPNVQMQQPPESQTAPQTMLEPVSKDPIFPADTSRNRPFTYPKPVKPFAEYNTLGQPVEMLPARMFHPPEPNLPQTLSPQPITKLRNDYMRFSNVKSTISKTSLMGNKPVGRTPSRNQLQHIYNQYKGSQSFTQQNVRSPVQGGTFSEGKLNVSPSNLNPPQLVPVEKVGGDTAANNQLASNQVPVKGQPMGNSMIGDVPNLNKPQGDAPIKPGSPVPARQARLRNGLQDVVYTSYPSSAAWSFHGTNTYRPITSVGYRFRNR